MYKTIRRVIIIILVILSCAFVCRKLVTTWQLRSVWELGWEAEHYLWMTGSSGHIRWDVERQIITHRYFKPYNLGHFFVSADNQVWGYGHGVWRFENDKWIEVYESTGQPYGMIYDMGQLADDTIWIATWWGFKSWDRENQQWETMLVEKPGRTLVQAPDGSLWFGLLEDGVMRFKSGELTAWNTTNGLVHNQTASVLAASDGTVWVGTLAGVSRWDGEQWQNWAHLGYPDADGLVVSKLYEMTNGVIWADTSQGLAKWEDEKWITNERFPSCLMVYSLVEMDDGNLWAGCGDGLFRWNKASWREYGKTEGISNNSNCQLLLGGNSVLYASTRSGIYSYIPQQDHWHLILDK